MKLALVFLAACALGGVARADGIDLGGWLMQMPSFWGPGAVLGFLVVSILIDYALNFLVLGLPAKRWSGMPLSKMARELVRYTLWAQVADRIGALLAMVAVAAMDPWLAKSGEGYFVMPLMVSKVVLSAFAIAFLVWRYARKRWGLTRGRAAILCALGGVLTNPGLGMLAANWLLPNPG